MIETGNPDSKKELPGIYFCITVEIMHHLGVAQIFHFGACVESQYMAVTGSQNDTLCRIEPDIFTVCVLGNDAGHLTVFCYLL